MAEENGGAGIRRADVYNIRFYESLPFYGSWRGMHYRIKGIPDESGTMRQLLVTTWPGPYNFDHTRDALKESAEFGFSEEGLDAAVEYLNRFYRENYA